MHDKQKIYISLLPIFIILLLIVGAGYFLLADEIKLPKFNKGPQIRRIEGFPTIVTVSEGAINEKQRLVIKDASTLNTFLNAVDKSGMLTMRDKINFDKEYVIAVSTETEKADGHRVKIKKVYENKTDKTLTVVVAETFPGENCPADVSNHVAVDLVALNKTTWTVDFERIKEVEECSKPESSSSN